MSAKVGLVLASELAVEVGFRRSVPLREEQLCFRAEAQFSFVIWVFVVLGCLAGKNTSDFLMICGRFFRGLAQYFFRMEKRSQNFLVGRGVLAKRMSGSGGIEVQNSIFLSLRRHVARNRAV